MKSLGQPGLLDLLGQIEAGGVAGARTPPSLSSRPGANATSISTAEMPRAYDKATEMPQKNCHVNEKNVIAAKLLMHSGVISPPLCTRWIGFYSAMGTYIFKIQL